MITPLLEGQHEKSKHAVTVQKRVDRELLLAVYEQSREVAILRVDKFGPLPSPQPAQVDNLNPTLQAAWDFLRPYVLKWICGETESIMAMRAEIREAQKARGIWKMLTYEGQAKAKAKAETEGETKSGADAETKW